MNGEYISCIRDRKEQARYGFSVSCKSNMLCWPCSPPLSSTVVAYLALNENYQDILVSFSASQ
uniref:Uncharacterized protein n=1 Tax=Arundo donax TaxID=35708 RepID=A0A0A9CBR4_ARUDO